MEEEELFVAVLLASFSLRDNQVEFGAFRSQKFPSSQHSLKMLLLWS